MQLTQKGESTIKGLKLEKSLIALRVKFFSELNFWKRYRSVFLFIRISTHLPQGHAAMEPILAAAQTMLESSTGLIQTARSLAVNPKDPPKWSVLAGHSRTVSDSIKKLITNIR